jgi:hypothetical protein
LGLCQRQCCDAMCELRLYEACAVYSSTRQRSRTAQHTTTPYVYSHWPKCSPAITALSHALMLQTLQGRSSSRSSRRVSSLALGGSANSQPGTRTHAPRRPRRQRAGIRRIVWAEIAAIGFALSRRLP